MKKLSKENLKRLNNLINDFNVKSIFDELNFLVKQDGDGMPVALSILEMIRDNSNDFTKDVAEKGLMAEDNHTLSYKQKWALAYQIKNNLEVYKDAVKEYTAFDTTIIEKEGLKKENPYSLFNRGGARFNEKYLDFVILKNNHKTIINGVEFTAHKYNKKGDIFYFEVKTPKGGYRGNSTQLRKLINN